ncbi:MAG TPA: signal recognition particle protein [Planctomycetota bacterium]|nr:signal recognition particle protein [Planctomycetota bacterium]
MFENLTSSLSSFFRKVSGKGKKLTEADIREGLRTVRMSLLEADVALPVVKEFIDKVSVKAVGQSVLEGKLPDGSPVEPSQQIVKIVHDELIALMGPVDSRIQFREDGAPTVILMAGLQGSGKTTTCAKLVNYLKRQGKKPLLVAADLQRPAAIEQLKVLGEQLETPVYSEINVAPPDLCARAIDFAKANKHDTVILDTAGRLQIDEALMNELAQVQAKTRPDEVFLVVDSMVGQDAVNSAKVFNQKLPITGVILTKLDGDSRGGAALSVKAITGKPIKFVGVGEKLDRLEEFHPERMATRILGMGDIVSLVEKAQEVLNKEQAEKFQEKMLKDSLTLDDFLTQLRAVKKMGSIKDLLGMIPGFAGLKELDSSDESFGTVEAVICSMTVEERRNPSIIGTARKKRIATGSGTTVNDVSRLMHEFERVTKQLSNFSKAANFMQKMVPGAGAPAKSLSADARKLLKKKRKLEKMNKKRNRR